jgi:hypothetical protein
MIEERYVTRVVLDSLPGLTMNYVLIGLVFNTNAFADDAVLINELLIEADNIGRQEHSITTAEIHIKTDRYERTMKMSIKSLGTEKSLIKILEPVKDAGVSTLKVDKNLWNYLPKVDRTMKLPSAMMGGSWMGSHLSNDDLVRDSRMSEDFTATLIQKPESSSENIYEIELIPKPDAPVVWGKVLARINTDKLPLDFRYYDESGTLIRTMKFDEIKEFDGKKMPAVMTIIPEDESGEFTRFTYVDVDFSTPVSAKDFTLQALRK